MRIPKRNIYSRELLESAVSKSTSFAGVCRELGVQPFTGAQSHISKKCRQFGVDTSHFSGKGWNKGKRSIPADVSRFLVKGAPTSSHRLKLRLIAAGMKPAHCEKCGLSAWLGNELPLELDHINGDHSDNRIENLLVVCPNCHAVKTRLGSWAKCESNSYPV